MSADPDPSELITLNQEDVPQHLLDAYWVARTWAVSDALAALCDCGVPEGTSESADPRDDWATKLPHHFDCAAAVAVPAVERAVRQRAARVLSSAAQAWETRPLTPPQQYVNTAQWLRERALGIESGQITV